MVWLVFFMVTLVFSNDPCTQVAYREVASYSEAMACYLTFKLSDEVKTSTMRSLKQAVPLVSLDYEHASMLKTALEIIEKEPFEREFDFHKSLKDLYARGNLEYDVGCFSSFTFQLPLELIIDQENDTLAVRVSSYMSYSSTMLPHWQDLGFEVLALRGRRVVNIDSREAISYLLEFAESQGSPHINSVLSRSLLKNGIWGIEAGSFAARKTPPQKDGLLVEFEDGEKIDLPFLASVPSGFHDSKSFYKNLCSPHKKPTQSLHGLHRKLMPQSTFHGKLVMIGKKAVLAISSFEDTSIWENEMHRALMYLQKHSIEELALDLRDSGGDHICGSYHLAEYLIPNNTIKQFSYILPGAPLIKKITVGCLEPENDCTDIPIFLGNAKCEKSFLENMPLPRHPFSSYKIKIITNGICEGACAILIHSLMRAGADNLNFFGPPGIQPVVGSGGFLYSLKKLNKYLDKKPSQMKTEGFPFLTDVDLTFTLGRPFEVLQNRIALLDELIPGNISRTSSENLMLKPLDLWKTVLGVEGDCTIPDF